MNVAKQETKGKVRRQINPLNTETAPPTENRVTEKDAEDFVKLVSTIAIHIDKMGVTL